MGVGKIRWRVLVILPITLIIIAAYYRTRPGDLGLDNPALPRLLGGLLDVATAAIIAAVGGGVGRRLIARIDLTTLSGPERLALEGAIGLGVMSLALLGLGLVGLFRGLAFWPIMVTLALLLRQDILGWLRDGWSSLRRLPVEGLWVKFMAALVVILLAGALVNALAPPFAWDSLVYHLTAVKLYLAEGRITTHAENAFLGFPQQVEMLYGLAVSLFGRDTAAAPLHFWYGLLGLMAAGGLARRLTDTATGWLAALLLLSAYSVWALFGQPYVDLAVMTYGALALVLWIGWRENRSTQAANGWLVLMGVCGGLALGVKYTAGSLLAALVLGVFLSTVTTSRREALRGAAVVIAVALLVFLPWLVKGLLLYHNPIYPFVFSGPNWDSIRTATFSAGHGLLGTPDAWQLLVLPVAAGIFGAEGQPGAAFTAGPWLLTAPLLLPLVWAWLDPRGRRLALDALILMVPLCLFWVFSAAFTGLGGQTRLVMMLLPLAALVGALTFRAVALGPYRDLQIVLRAALALTLLISLAESLRLMAGESAPRYLTGSISREEALSADLGAYYGATQQLSRLPAGSQVLLMWEPRSYYCPANVTCIADVTFDHWSHPLKTGQTPDGVFADWRGEGAGYLLLWQTGYEGWRDDPNTPPEEKMFSEALDRWMSPMWSDGIRYTLYTWKEGAAN